MLSSFPTVSFTCQINYIDLDIDRLLEEPEANFTSYSLVDISVSATNYSCRHHSSTVRFDDEIRESIVDYLH